MIRPHGSSDESKRYINSVYRALQALKVNWLQSQHTSLNPCLFTLFITHVAQNASVETDGSAVGMWSHFPPYVSTD